MKILLVDDQKYYSDMVSDFLAGKGFDVYTANNGKVCIEKAKVIKPDLILTDIDMPVMSGSDAVKILRKGGYKGLIIACTGHIDHKKLFNSGCNYIISKPFSLNKFFKDIVRYMELHISKVSIKIVKQ